MENTCPYGNYQCRITTLFTTPEHKLNQQDLKCTSQHSAIYNRKYYIAEHFPAHLMKTSCIDGETPSTKLTVSVS